MLILAVAASAKKKPETFSNYVYGKNDQCSVLSLKFEKGKEHNHPLYAVWLADERLIIPKPEITQPSAHEGSSNPS